MVSWKGRMVVCGMFLGGLHPSQPMLHDTAPTPMADPCFMWGGIDADSLMHSITAAYAEVVNWRRNRSTGKRWQGLRE